MIIKSSRKQCTKINIHNIEQKTYIKYLGIYLDEILSWEAQIKHVNKLSKNIRIINKLGYYLDINMLKQLYYTLIYPYLSYGVMSWGNTYPTKLTKIQTEQNKCIFANSKEKAIRYFKLLEILQLYNIIKLKVAILTYEIFR